MEARGEFYRLKRRTDEFTQQKTDSLVSVLLGKGTFAGFPEVPLIFSDCIEKNRQSKNLGVHIVTLQRNCFSLQADHRPFS